jgi:Zn-dependent protease with chaperone function
VIATAAVAALVVLLVSGGIHGPRLLAAAPGTLSAYPRVGMAIWTCAVGLWTVALLLLGPMLTWIFAGPALPGDVGVTCQRCLAAANPFAHPAWDLGVPSIVLLAVPILLLSALALRAALRHMLGRRRMREYRHALERSSELRTLHRVAVRVTGGELPDVHCVPGLGVVVSEGALAALSEVELATVLAHEQAHLAQRHHLLLAAVGTVRDVLGWIPLVRAAPKALGTYAEMAADDAARRRTSTAALASALLALGRDGAEGWSSSPEPVPAMHAASGDPTWRVRRLARDVPAPVAPVARLGGYLATLALVITAVGLPYLGVAVAGSC